MDSRSRDRRRWVRLVAGWIFILLGVAGLFLPFLQGILFLFIGGTLLSLASPRMRLVRMRLGARFPAFRAGHDKARAWLRTRGRRFGVGRPASGDGPPASAS